MAVGRNLSDQKFEKNRPIFINVAKIVAKLQKLILKVENSCIKLLLNVKISYKLCLETSYLGKIKKIHK
jgi:hypothetical protein